VGASGSAHTTDSDRRDREGILAAPMTTPRREQRSLFGEILDWMLAPLLLLWPMSVVLTWLVAQGIANKPYDRQLGEMVRVLSKQVSVQAPGGGRVRVRCRGASEILHTDESDDIYYQVLGCAAST
jgi:two-component system sensor histidine kinase TctE